MTILNFFDQLDIRYPVKKNHLSEPYFGWMPLSTVQATGETYCRAGDDHPISDRSEVAFPRTGPCRLTLHPQLTRAQYGRGTGAFSENYHLAQRDSL